MAIMDAPVYDARSEKRKEYALMGAAATVVLLVVLTLLGFVTGHGWLFTNLPAEHKVDRFFSALEAKDYGKAYDLWTNGHPDSAYPLARFTEDWTKYSPVKAPITCHKVDISRTDGKGAFGSGVIVAARINGDNKVFMFENRADGTLTWPAAHELGYEKKPLGPDCK